VSTRSAKITTGVHLWWKTGSPRVWVELGPDKTKAFLATSKVAKAFLLLIPAPWGELLYAFKVSELKKAEAARGPNGIFIRLPGPRTFRARTAATKNKAPSPW
jgi:hypothetical protein